MTTVECDDMECLWYNELQVTGWCECLEMMHEDM
jgi:hypothetical protein